MTQLDKLPKSAMKKDIILTVNFEQYDLILSDDPCEIFKHYGVQAMHGLSLADCQAYSNTSEDAYIAGWCNISPTGKPFVFINLSRCTDLIKATGLVMHEMCHLYRILTDDEEKAISGAEAETYKVMEIVKAFI